MIKGAMLFVLVYTGGGSIDVLHIYSTYYSCMVAKGMFGMPSKYHCIPVDLDWPMEAIAYLAASGEIVDANTLPTPKLYEMLDPRGWVNVDGSPLDPNAVGISIAIIQKYIQERSS